MLLRLRLDGRRPRLWHARLIERLGGAPDRRVEVDARPGPEAWPAEADLLFRLESLIYRLPAGGLAAALDPAALAAWPRPGTERPDLVIDLCGDVDEADSAVLWRVAFDGRVGEAALLASLLDGRAPVAQVVENGQVLRSGRLGTEARGVVRTGFEDALARTRTLIEAAFAGPLPGPSAPPEPLPAQRLTLAGIGRRGARMLGRGLVQRLYRLCYRTPHWRVGWRSLDGPDLIALRRHPDAGWRDLPDDGLRFYADPFPIVHEGRCWLFVEEYVHALGKALISAVAFGPQGPVGAPVPVLETPHHLSYPFVFARDGDLWMVPESCASGTVDLYRATAFPGGWVKAATLVSGLAASDATLVEHGGRWWMFATVRDAPASAPLGSGSFSDALHLWSAPDFRGPWTPHPRNPVLVDIASARPAGRIVSRDGQLIRPVQDCRLAYGQALALARIERLDDEAFVQRVETRLQAGAAWPGTLLHTLNAAGGFEFIDGSGRAPRFRRRGA